MALTDPDVTYRDVTFHITKLMPMDAKRVFLEHVRPLLKGALEIDAPSTDDAGGALWAMLLSLVANAPQVHYDALMRVLYRNIYYSSPNQTTPKQLAGDEENAFRDLDMAHILLLDGQAFVVNFSGSWDVLQSEFPSIRQAISQLMPQT